MAAEVTTLATKHFNRGVRAYYFALAMLASFIHPLLFVVTTTGVVLVLYLREFHSPALRVLSRIKDVQQSVASE